MMFTENKPSTEPFSFIFLKKLCSFALVIILVFYTYNQFSQFSGSIDKPNINVRRQNSKKALSEIQNIKIILARLYQMSVDSLVLYLDSMYFYLEQLNWHRGDFCKLMYLVAYAQDIKGNL
ncbi:hypothetical protein RhiirA4_424485 [Rhizophagus irregularis]|uniref:Uncharacterized protein n=1 Tax=Rhizophagus irregularis TaxID=588596 RepID=A0A2I1GXQ1_9GLOM|nr:hypothetical protein RhiirA4_424485 [Rhizophagus irregularis]